MVGLSSEMKDSKVEAPMLSPEETKTVFGLVSRNSLTCAASRPAIWLPSGMVFDADQIRPWKSLMPSS